MSQLNKEVAGVPATKRPAMSDLVQEFKKLTTEDPTSHQDLQEGVGFDDLLDELIVKILSNLPTKDILMNVARVSKRLHRLSQDPDAHVAVQFPDLTSVRRKPVLDFLKGKNKIQDVKMEVDSKLSRSVFKLAVMNQRMTRSLSLEFQYSDNPTPFQLLARSPQKAQQIRKLRILQLYDRFVIPDFVNLVELHYVTDDPCYDSVMGNFVADIALKSKKLASIVIDESLPLERLWRLLDRHGNRLKRVELSDAETSRGFAQHLVANKGGKMLEKLSLDLAEMDLSPEVVLGCSEVVLRLENLKVLKMSGIPFCPDLPARIVSSINLNKMKTLELGGERSFEMSIGNSCLIVEGWKGILTQDVLSEILRAGVEKEGLQKVVIKAHLGTKPSNRKQDLPVLQPTGLLLEKGKTFYIKAYSAFTSTQKLTDLMSVLTSSSPLSTVTINYNTPLSVELVKNLKEMIPGRPTMIAKVSI